MRTAMKTRSLSFVFWSCLLAFIAWDSLHSKPVDLRSEPPLIAAGSGKPPVLGHCAVAR